MKRMTRSAFGAWVLAAAVLAPPLARADEGSKDSSSKTHEAKTHAQHKRARKKVVHALKSSAEHERNAAEEERAAAKAQARAARAEKSMKGTGGSGSVAAKEAEAARKQSKATHEDVKALSDDVQALKEQISDLQGQLSRRSELACGSAPLSVRRQQAPAIVGESGATGHVWGKVESADNDRLVIRGPAHNLFPVWVNEDTDARKKEHDISVGEVKVGDTVDVAVATREGDLIARDVKVVPDEEKEDREKAEEHRALEKERAKSQQKPPAFDAHTD